MKYRRILTIQDISCVGQCSMTVALPILSACGHETCILPTAVLSTHTGGFGKPVVHHLKDSLDGMWRHWKSQGITFDAILVGYLGSLEAVALAVEILDELKAPGGISIVDPAMADHGKLYSGFDGNYAAAMQSLCEKADYMIPNITEAAMMTGMSFRAEYDQNYILELLEKLGGNQVVLTGVSLEPGKTGAALRYDGKISFCQHEKIGKNYHGTGDMFAACFTGALLQGLPAADAMALAGEFVLRSIVSTEQSPAHWYGVKFETVLPWLTDVLFP